MNTESVVRIHSSIITKDVKNGNGERKKYVKSKCKILSDFMGEQPSRDEMDMLCNDSVMSEYDVDRWFRRRIMEALTLDK